MNEYRYEIHLMNDTDGIWKPKDSNLIVMGKNENLATREAEKNAEALYKGQHWQIVHLRLTKLGYNPDGEI